MTSQILADQTTIERLARTHGYELVRILTLDADTYMPTVLIIATAATVRAEIVIAPDLNHFGIGYRGVPDTCDVLVSAGMAPRRARPVR